MGWAKDKVAALRNKSTRGPGGYEEPLGSFSAQGGRGGRRGFGALDPDDAWDARVGTEADAYGPGGYYEEAEVGLHDTHTGYAGNVHGDHTGRGRTMAEEDEDSPYIGGSQRGLDRRYDEEMGGVQKNKGKGKESNPFDDEAEIDLRGVSPRPVADERVGRFREDV